MKCPEKNFTAIQKAIDEWYAERTAENLKNCFLKVTRMLSELPNISELFGKSANSYLDIMQISLVLFLRESAERHNAIADTFEEED